MSIDRAAELIRKHEGFRDYVYLDSEGIPTCGYGHALIEGSYVPPYICERFFYQDIKSVINDYNILNFDLDTVRKAVVLNMLFNLGRNRFNKFKKMIKALRKHDYETAAMEILRSKYARQVGKRAVELANMMETGEWPDGIS